MLRNAACRIPRALQIGAAMLCAMAPAASRARSYDYATITVPGGIQTVFGAMNALGDVAGYWVDPGRNQHGFLSVGKKLTSIDVAGSTATSVTGINSARVLVGYWIDAKGEVHGFRWSNGVFTDIDIPGNTFTQPLQINDAGDIAGVTIAGSSLSYIQHAGIVTAFRVGVDGSFPTALNVRGTLVGHFDDRKDRQQAFVRRGGVIHPLTIPNADLVELTALNDSGSFVGYYHSAVQPSPNLNGFIQKGGARTTINYPGTTVTQLSGINAAGLIVGYFAPVKAATLRSFAYDGTTFTAINPPNATECDAQAVNNAGQIAGNFAGGAGQQVFVATPR